MTSFFNKLITIANINAAATTVAVPRHPPKAYLKLENEPKAIGANIQPIIIIER